MKASRVNYYSVKSHEIKDSSEERDEIETNHSSVPIQYTIYAQVLETLIEVCKEDKEGTINFVTKDDSKIQDIAAIRFQQSHSLKNIKENTMIWATILDEFKITQDELPAIFYLLVFCFSLVFYTFFEVNIQSMIGKLGVSSFRLEQLRLMCQKLINRM